MATQRSRVPWKHPALPAAKVGCALPADSADQRSYGRPEHGDRFPRGACRRARRPSDDQENLGCSRRASNLSTAVEKALPLQMMRPAEWNADFGMRNAELPAARLIPHSEFGTPQS